MCGFYILFLFIFCVWGAGRRIIGDRLSCKMARTGLAGTALLSYLIQAFHVYLSFHVAVFDQSPQSHRLPLHNFLRCCTKTGSKRHRTTCFAKLRTCTLIFWAYAWWEMTREVLKCLVRQEPRVGRGTLCETADLLCLSLIALCHLAKTESYLIWSVSCVLLRSWYRKWVRAFVFN